MNTKLTLTIEKEIIAQAKEYAKSQNRSLSNIIEDYLRAILANKEEEQETTVLPPIVNSLRGAVKVPDPHTIEGKQILEDELMKKYLS